MLVFGAGAAWSRLFCLEPEPTQFGRSRLRDLGLPEPEPPKKGQLRYTGLKANGILCEF